MFPLIKLSQIQNEQIINTVFLLLSGFIFSQNDWIHKVRISGNPLTLNNIDSIVQHAEDSHVFGIEVDNDIPGRYESFLNPKRKIRSYKASSEKSSRSR